MKTKILLLVMVLSTLLLTACQTENDGYFSDSIFSRPTVERPAEGRKAWKDVSSFVCYYGEFDIEFQSMFDVIIMHTSVLEADPDAKEKVHPPSRPPSLAELGP